jgi:hypothetical protein
MAKKDPNKQEDMFPQKRIPAIESAIMAADKKRAEIEEQESIIDGLKEELTPLEDGIRVALHSYEDQIDHQETPKGDRVLIYKKGDFEATVKQHERLSYAKLRQPAPSEVGG